MKSCRSISVECRRYSHCISAVFALCSCQVSIAFEPGLHCVSVGTRWFCVFISVRLVLSKLFTLTN